MVETLSDSEVGEGEQMKKKILSTTPNAIKLRLRRLLNTPNDPLATRNKDRNALVNPPTNEFAAWFRKQQDVRQFAVFTPGGVISIDTTLYPPGFVAQKRNEFGIVPAVQWTPAIRYDEAPTEDIITPAKPEGRSQQRENIAVKNVRLQQLRTRYPGVLIGYTNNDADIIYELDGILYLEEAKFSPGKIYAAVGQVGGYAFAAETDMLAGFREHKPVVKRVIFSRPPESLGLAFAKANNVEVIVVGGSNG